MSTLTIIQALLVEEFDLKPEQVVPEAVLTELGVDSLSTIEFMFLLEEKFLVTLPAQAAPIKTVGDIANEIENLLAAQNKKAPSE